MSRIPPSSSRRQFAVGFALRLVLYVWSILAFPWLLQGFAIATNCASTSGACGAVGLLGSMVWKPLTFDVFILSLIGLCAKRVRDLGVSGRYGLIIPLLFCADYQFFLAFGAPWTMGFSLGIMSVPLPVMSLTALALAILLSAAPAGLFKAIHPIAGPALLASVAGFYLLSSFLVIDIVLQSPVIMMAAGVLYRGWNSVDWVGFVGVIIFALGTIGVEISWSQRTGASEHGPIDRLSGLLRGVPMGWIAVVVTFAVAVGCLALLPQSGQSILGSALAISTMLVPLILPIAGVLTMAIGVACGAFFTVAQQNKPA